MKTEKAYYVGSKPLSFGGGKPVEILGICIVTKDGAKPMPCFHLRESLGVEGFESVSEIFNYQIVSTVFDKQEGRV